MFSAAAAANYMKDALVEAVAGVNKNTIVVVNSVGPINMEAWINNVNGAWSSWFFAMIIGL